MRFFAKKSQSKPEAKAGVPANPRASMQAQPNQTSVPGGQQIQVRPPSAHIPKGTPVAQLPTQGSFRQSNLPQGQVPNLPRGQVPNLPQGQVPNRLQGQIPNRPVSARGQNNYPVNADNSLSSSSSDGPSYSSDTWVKASPVATLPPKESVARPEVVYNADNSTSVSLSPSVVSEQNYREALDRQYKEALELVRHNEVTRDLVKKFIVEIWNRGELDLIPHVCSRRLRFNGTMGLDRVGHEGFSTMVTTIRDAFEDFHCGIHSMVVEGNKAFCRVRFSGRHTRTLLGYEPTGRHVKWMGSSEFTVANGKILKVWDMADMKGLEDQLRASPS